MQAVLNPQKQGQSDTQQRYWALLGALMELSQNAGDDLYRFNTKAYFEDVEGESISVTVDYNYGKNEEL